MYLTPSLIKKCALEKLAHEGEEKGVSQEIPLAFRVANRLHGKVRMVV